MPYAVGPYSFVHPHHSIATFSGPMPSHRVTLPPAPHMQMYHPFPHHPGHPQHPPHPHHPSPAAPPPPGPYYTPQPPPPTPGTRHLYTMQQPIPVSIILLLIFNFNMYYKYNFLFNSGPDRSNGSSSWTKQLAWTHVSSDAIYDINCESSTSGNF